MKPPSAQAIKKALRILLDNVAEENATNPSLSPKVVAAEKLDFASLQRRWEALEVAHDAVATEFKTQIANAGRAKNSFLPVNTLPFELTASILLRSMTPRDHQDLNRLHALSQVQTLWWNAVKAHPYLWTCVHVGDLDATHLKLRKSGSLPLKIICSGSVPEGCLKDSLTALEPHKGRVKSFDYRWRSVKPGQDFVESGMSRLEHLVLVSMQTGDPAVLQLSGEAPLRHLELVRVALRWESAKLSQLTTLRLGDYNMKVSLADFAKTVRSCSQLERIEIEDVDANDRIEASAPPIILPTLRSLIVRNVIPAFILPLLVILHADGLTCCILEYEGDPDCSLIMKGLFNAPSLPPALSSMLTNKALQLQRIDIEIQDCLFAIVPNFAGEEGRMKITLSDNLTWIRGLGHMDHMSLSSYDAPIHVTFLDDLEEDNVDAFPGDLSLVAPATAFHFECGPRILRSVATSLLGDAKSWPCPKLEEVWVDIEKCSWIDDSEERKRVGTALEALLEGRNGEEARNAGIPKVTLHTERGGLGITEAQDVSRFIYDPDYIPSV